MKLNSKLQNKWDKLLEALRFRLARPDALLQLALLGLVTGFLAGGVIVLFRFLVEGSQDAFLPGDGSENYEGLDATTRFLLPVISGVLLALIFYKFSKGIRVLGITRVMERMAYHQGYMTLRGFIMQFLTAAIAIIGGHSIGREGPHVYLGASSGSLFGQYFKLPNNSIRTLVASGAAAGIAASFNTPLAGVIFALEVILMEYTLSSFVPIILASVVATALSNAVLGGEPAFSVPALHAISLKELPIVFVLGIVAGSFSALFSHLLMLITTKTKAIEIWWKISVAGILVGFLGLIQPEVLGIGYDTVNASLLGDFTLGALLSMMFLKLLASSISIGLGVPGGMIGPVFFIGGTLGGAVGLIAMWVYGDSISHVGFYVLLGMGAMMGASLQAPLAALTAIMELTYNPGIIMPGMLVIVVAQLTSSEIFNKHSLFVTMLRSHGLDFSADPVMQMLRSIGVASVLDTNFEKHDEQISLEEVRQTIDSGIKWLLINNKDGDVASLLPITELLKYLQRREVSEDKLTLVSEANHKDIEKGGQEEEGDINENTDINKEKEENYKSDYINLLEIPAKRLDLTPISLQANLMEAQTRFLEGAEALFVVFQEDNFSRDSRIYGILTKQTIEEAYVPKAIKTIS